MSGKKISKQWIQKIYDRSFTKLKVSIAFISCFIYYLFLTSFVKTLLSIIDKGFLTNVQKLFHIIIYFKTFLSQWIRIFTAFVTQLNANENNIPSLLGIKDNLIDKYKSCLKWRSSSTKAHFYCPTFEYWNHFQLRIHWHSLNWLYVYWKFYN